MAMASTEPILDRVLARLRREFPTARSVRPTDRLMGGVIDSMGLMNLVTVLEAEFGVTLDDADLTLKNFRDATAIAAMIERRLTP